MLKRSETEDDCNDCDLGYSYSKEENFSSHTPSIDQVLIGTSNEFLQSFKGGGSIDS